MSRTGHTHHHELHRGIEKSNYTGYEHMELTTESKHISFLLECYAAFGWELDAYAAQYRGQHSRHTGAPEHNKIVLPLKRDRKILNKTELTRLQRNFEACMQELRRLEKRKTSKAITLALIVGFVGGIFAVGAILAAIANPPHMIWSVLFAIPALIGCAVPYPLYRRICAEETARVTALMDQKYEEIHAICMRGYNLTREK